jgi:hypothetical protein
VVTPGDAAPLERLHTLRIAASSVAPPIDNAMDAPCVLALLGFRLLEQHRTPRGDH